MSEEGELQPHTCPACGAPLQAMIEYSWDSPFYYDGISELRFDCGHRIGRWSGKVLADGEAERPFGYGMEGTTMNYFWQETYRTAKRHIGYSRPGEMFALHVYPSENIVGLADWQERWSRPGSSIEDENGNEVSAVEMQQELKRGQSGPIEEEASLYSDEHSKGTEEVQ